MFTGIVKAQLPVVYVKKLPKMTKFTLDFPQELVQGLQEKASVSVSGVCVTVVNCEGTRVSFDAMEETLRLTTIGTINEGSLVNVERSVTVGDEIGGHLVSGHVAGMAEIMSIEKPENNHVVKFRVPEEFMKYIFPKGFIALDGASLTVVDVDKKGATFTVWFIPETLRVTTFGVKGIGDRVNFEIDSGTRVLVDTIEAFLPEALSRLEAKRSA